MRTNVRTLVQLYCNNAYEDTTSLLATFASTDNFYIGNGFYGLMKDFKIFQMALGAETFTHSTSSKPLLLSAFPLSHWPVLRRRNQLVPALSRPLLPVHFWIQWQLPSLCH